MYHLNFNKIIRGKAGWDLHKYAQQIYGHLSPISYTIQIRQAIDAGYSWWSQDELRGDILP